MAQSNPQQPSSSCRTLVLDAGPLLSLTPLRGLAERYVTVPHVLLELKDKDAREHFEKLSLINGVSIEVLEPDPASILQVTQTARKTGDYGVLSNADMRVLALTYMLDKQEKERKSEELPTASTENTLSASIKRAQGESVNSGTEDLANAVQSISLENDDNSAPPTGVAEINEDEIAPRGPLENEYSNEPSKEGATSSTSSPTATGTTPQATVVFEDPSDSDDGEGDWITPSNVGFHKSRALDLLPSVSSSDPFTPVTRKRGKSRKQQGEDAATEGPQEQIAVGCMTADFAMQNVLLQMDLRLVSVEGKRIRKVKNWVMRCHACFKICKDNSRKFCPSCGNPTLLRTTVTVSAPNTPDGEPALQVHLKKNFVYRNRGTKYSIPAPKPGTSKTGSGEGLILREDQLEYMRAKKRQDTQREKEEKRMMQQSLKATSDGTGLKLGNWSDPDWMPELLSIGTGGKGRKMADSRIGPDGMPIIGYGRKNPNERRRKA